MFSRIQNSQSLGFVFSVVICASVARVAIAQTPNTNFWKGTNSSSWSDPANWSLGHTPLSSEVVGFSNLSTNLTLNNDVSACAPGDLNCDGTADARDYVF